MDLRNLRLVIGAELSKSGLADARNCITSALVDETEPLNCFPHPCQMQSCFSVNNKYGTKIA